MYEDGEIVRDFVFVDDVVTRSRPPSPAAGGERPLDIGSGVPTTIHEVAAHGRGEAARRRPTSAAGTATVTCRAAMVRHDGGAPPTSATAGRGRSAKGIAAWLPAWVGEQEPA